MKNSTSVGMNGPPFLKYSFAVAAPRSVSAVGGFSVFTSFPSSVVVNTLFAAFPGNVRYVSPFAVHNMALCMFVPFISSAVGTIFTCFKSALI